MMYSMTRKLALLLIVVVFVGGVAGCGSATQDETAAGEGQETNEESTAGNAADEADETVTTTVARESELIDTEIAPLKQGEPAPDFTYTLPDGTTHSLSDFKGKKVLINFWATWCPPCKAEMPDIQEAFERFEDEGFLVIGVSQDGDVDLIEPFAQEYGVTFPLIADPDHHIGTRYGVRGMPVSYFVDTDGAFYGRKMGMVDVSFIEDILNEME
jgi:cytochrome c-type biogenesis protein